MNKNKNTRDINLYNKSFKLLMDKYIVCLLDERKEVLSKLNNKEINPVFEKESRRLLKNLLTKKNIPICWVEPLFNTIMSGIGDTPLGDGIHIDIDGITVTSNTASIYVTKDLYDEGDIPHSFNIVISRDVSIEDLKNFIKDNEFYLSRLQKLLRLPNDPPIRSKATLYALAVIRLKDEENKSFEEISTFITDAINSDDRNDPFDPIEKQKLLKMASTAENVRKNLYDRFKKKYLRLKNSSK